MEPTSIPMVMISFIISSVEYAGRVFTGVYEKLLAGKADKVMFAMVPDKNNYLAESAGMLHMDYNEFYEEMQNATAFSEHIDLRDFLSIEDYYLTDTHWRQENIADVALRIAECLGTNIPLRYEARLVDEPFKGVYFSQLGLNLETEDLYYLTNEIIEGFEVFDYESNKAIPVYNEELAAGADPYEIFLSGPLSLVTIENPDTNTQKELIIFRDSFGSSITPLLAEGYSKITVVDVRYVMPTMLGTFRDARTGEKLLDFKNADVLFLYSSLVLNNSSTIK